MEKWKRDDYRSDIRDRLPNNIDWYLAYIEERDVEKLFIISSDDWRRVTPTFRLSQAVDALENNLNDSHIHDISRKKEIYQRNLDGLDRKLILVSPSEDGNFTIIEGNKRAVALQSIDKLVGNTVYLGISTGILDYLWSRYSKC